MSSIRSKIIAFQIFFGLLLMVMAAVVYFAITRADSYIERVSHTHRQLEATTELSLRANRYSEQIAEMLLFGREGVPELDEARRDLELSFDRLEQVTRAELSNLDDPQERNAERIELALIDEMRALSLQMNDTAMDLLRVVVAGGDRTARQRYYAEIEEDLDDKLQDMIDLAIADEQREVSAVNSQTAELARELILIVGVTTLIAIASSIGAVLLLTRALSRPIERLTAGAGAIGSGRLAHRIVVEGNDELALLSRHFNRMAEQLECQRSELLQHQALLEEKVTERTQQLEEANRRLKDLDRLRVLFLADVSHELRTPIAVLRGEAEVTLRSRTSSGDDYRETLERVVELAEQMSRLVDDLLFVTRAEADSIRFEMRRIDLRRAIERAAADGHVLALSAGVDLDLDLDRALPPLPVQADLQRMHQMLLIIIDNAVKYSQPRTPVEIAAANEGDRVAVRIRNRGAGVPPEDLPYVFDRFYRGRQPARGSAGSGLGLSIAKWIVEKHGGSIAMTSEPGGVTQVEIRLPRARAGMAGPQDAGTRPAYSAESV
jgi:signal transduction histidine kinase